MTKIFISGTRPLKWKNKERLYRAFDRARQVDSDLILDDESVKYEQFLGKIKNAYAVILVSLGDISPNLILDAIRYNKPFILTQENGLNDRIRDVGVLVDPENLDDITSKILWLSKEENYKVIQDKLKQFDFTHTWVEIAKEFLLLQEKL